MPRKSLIRSSIFPYHVTGRANNREIYHCSLDQVWTAHTVALYEAGIVYGARVHSFVLMPNHFHLIISTPNEDLGKVMQHMLASVTRTINRKAGRTGRVYGARYFQSLIETPRYFSAAYKYIYRNPVRAQITHRVEDYAWSTLHALLGKRHLPFPIYFPYDLNYFPKMPTDIDNHIRWLNHPFRTEIEQAIQFSLKKTVFAPPKNGWKRTLLEMDDVFEIKESAPAN